MTDWPRIDGGELEIRHADAAQLAQRSLLPGHRLNLVRRHAKKAAYRYENPAEILVRLDASGEYAEEMAVVGNFMETMSANIVLNRMCLLAACAARGHPHPGAVVVAGEADAILSHAKSLNFRLDLKEEGRRVRERARLKVMWPLG